MTMVNYFNLTFLFVHRFQRLRKFIGFWLNGFFGRRNYVRCWEWLPIDRIITREREPLTPVRHRVQNTMSSYPYSIHVPTSKPLIGMCAVPLRVSSFHQISQIRILWQFHISRSISSAICTQNRSTFRVRTEIAVEISSSVRFLQQAGERFNCRSINMENKIPFLDSCPDQRSIEQQRISLWVERRNSAAYHYIDWG